VSLISDALGKCFYATIFSENSMDRTSSFFYCKSIIIKREGVGVEGGLAHRQGGKTDIREHG
jgi:hypothetical protein